MDFSDWKKHKYDDTFCQIDVKDKVVIDLCCLHGRAGANSLDQGAKYVKFIDAIKSDQLKENFQHYSKNKCEHILLDLTNESQKLVDYLQDADICLYFGHLYHATNHFDILRYLSKSNITNLVIDTSWPLWLGDYEMWNSDQRLIIYDFEPTDGEVKAFSNEYDKLFVGMPNKQWIKDILTAQFGWKIISDEEAIIDFNNRQQVRYMIRLERTNNE